MGARNAPGPHFNLKLIQILFCLYEAVASSLPFETQLIYYDPLGLCKQGLTRSGPDDSHTGCCRAYITQTNSVLHFLGLMAKKDGRKVFLPAFFNQNLFTISSKWSKTVFGLFNTPCVLLKLSWNTFSGLRGIWCDMPLISNNNVR